MSSHPGPKPQPVTAQAQTTWRARHSEGVQISRHMERLAALRRRRRRLSQARRPAPAASAGWATASAATLGGGARPCASREGIPIAVRVGRDVWNAGSLRGLRWCRSLRSFTRRPRCARSCSRRARDTGEAQLRGRDWWVALDGQARDQSRLNEGDGTTRDRDGAGTAPRSTLRQRHRRARPGAGPGEGCRGGCCARQGRCSLVAGQLPKVRGGRNRERCSGCRGCVRASGGTSAAQDPGDADLMYFLFTIVSSRKR